MRGDEEMRRSIRVRQHHPGSQAGITRSAGVQALSIALVAAAPEVSAPPGASGRIWFSRSRCAGWHPPSCSTVDGAARHGLYVVVGVLPVLAEPRPAGAATGCTRHGRAEQRRHIVDHHQRAAMVVGASSTVSAAANAPRATTTATAANQSDKRNFMMLPPCAAAVASPSMRGLRELMFIIYLREHS